MAALLDPLVAKLAEKQDARPGPLATAVGSRVTGAQAGGVLAFLSSRVLGQYEVFGTGGRLLLVAPNIVETERSSASTRPTSGSGLSARGDPPAAVHRRAVAARHLEGEIAEFVAATDLTADVLRERLHDVLRSLGGGRPGRRRRVGGAHGADPATRASAPSSTGSPR